MKINVVDVIISLQRRQEWAFVEGIYDHCEDTNEDDDFYQAFIEG